MVENFAIAVMLLSSQNATAGPFNLSFECMRLVSWSTVSYDETTHLPVDEWHLDHVIVHYFPLIRMHHTLVDSFPLISQVLLCRQYIAYYFKRTIGYISFVRILF